LPFDEIAAVPAKPDTDPAAFAAVDLRVGVVTTVEAFPEARRPAWRIEVDFGDEFGRRWTSAQVTNYGADELVGRRVVGAINLGSRRIAGFVSQFLLLGAVDDDDVVTLLEVAADVPLGAPVA